MSQRRVPAVDAEIVRVQRVPGAGIQQPRMHRFSLEEQVVIRLNIG
jgi:hypothetical protein